MDPKALAQAVFQAILEALADQVVARLRARQHTALVLFTGTGLGLDAALAAVKALRQEGWTLKLACSEAASRLLSPELLGELGAEAAPAAAGTEAEVDALLAGCTRVLVPALSPNAAAKVACGIRDCVASRVLARALEQGLPILAAQDGCCPEHPGSLAPEAYRARLRANLEALRSYGIRLVAAEALADAARAGLSPDAGSAARTLAAVAPARLPDPIRGRAGKRLVFGRSDAVQCPPGELRLDRGVLVTPLAVEELRLRNVQLILN